MKALGDYSQARPIAQFRNFGPRVDGSLIPARIDIDASKVGGDEPSPPNPPSIIGPRSK